MEGKVDGGANGGGRSGSSHRRSAPQILDGKAEGEGEDGEPWSRRMERRGGEAAESDPRVRRWEVAMEMTPRAALRVEQRSRVGEKERGQIHHGRRWRGRGACVAAGERTKPRGLRGGGP